MDGRIKVVCEENEAIAAYLLNKWREMAQGPKGISDNIEITFSKAHSNVCNCKAPIQTLKDLSQIKGVGKWILRQMRGFFESDSGPSENDDMAKKGKKTKGPKRYVPQKNSVAYALLITLFRETDNGSEFMRKNELIDAAETSGLSRVPIRPEKVKGKAGHFESSPRDWYSGWTCMKTLINRGLVVKSSCPAKYAHSSTISNTERAANLEGCTTVPSRASDFYENRYMLTEEGKETARECLVRSGATVANEKFKSLEVPLDLEQRDRPKVNSQRGSLDVEFIAASVEEEVVPSLTKKKSKRPLEVPLENLDKVKLKYTQVKKIQPHPIATSSNQDSTLHDFGGSSCMLRACSSSDRATNKLSVEGSGSKPNTLPMPPLAFGERFEDCYDVILILDDREQFATQGSRSRKIIENICSQFRIQIEVRRLPVGDGVWIARHKYLFSEYVLDFIVERKKVDDLRQSIRDNRYKDQKMRLLRCGLKKMIYLVEGDPNASEAAESIKTACFTTEILEGFDVQRTSGLADTLKKYGFLTRAINQYYRSMNPEQGSPGACPPFKEFIRSCEESDKMTVSDVFAIQLMQVPQVTEDIALAVLDMYPTLSSLGRAYSLLDGNVGEQEEMLRKQSNNLINASASKNIYQLVWGG